MTFCVRVPLITGCSDVARKFVTLLDINGDNNDNDEIMINESGQNLIPLYCVPFGLIVLLLIGYVIIKRWRLCCTAPSKSLPSTSSMKPILDHGSLTNRSARQEIKPMLGNKVFCCSFCYF